MKYTAFNSLEIATLAVLPLLVFINNTQTALMLLLATLVVYGLSYVCVYALRHVLTKTYKILFYLVFAATLVSMMTLLFQMIEISTLKPLHNGTVFVLLSSSILAIAPLYSSEAPVEKIIKEILRTVIYFVVVVFVSALFIELLGYGTIFSQYITNPTEFFQTFSGKFMVVIAVLFVCTSITYYIQKIQNSYKWLVARYKINFRFMRSEQIKESKGENNEL